MPRSRSAAEERHDHEDRRHDAHARQAAGARALRRGRVPQRGRQPVAQRDRRKRRSRPASAATRCTTPTATAASATPASPTWARKACSAAMRSTSTWSATRCAAASVLGVGDRRFAQPLGHDPRHATTSSSATASATRASATATSWKTAPRSTTCSTATWACRPINGKRLPKQVLPFDPNDGAAFWWANGRNTLTRNVGLRERRVRLPLRHAALEVLQQHAADPACPTASTKPVDVRTIPIWRFDDNESHTEGLVRHGRRGQRQQPARHADPRREDARHDQGDRLDRPRHAASARHPQPEDLGGPLRLPPAQPVDADGGRPHSPRGLRHLSAGVRQPGVPQPAPVASRRRAVQPRHGRRQRPGRADHRRWPDDRRLSAATTSGIRSST